MVTCEVCGGENFEKHAGFMYCAVCQTQSQDYYEQEYDYEGHELNISRKIKVQAPAATAKKKENFFDDGLWTTWEGFNYILYGMSEEMKKCGAGEEFSEMVLKLWAAYLKECQAAFISKHRERIPKLRYRFKERDARILYNKSITLDQVKKRKVHNSNSCSKVSDTSGTSQSKRTLSKQKGKIVASEYKDHLSNVSMQSSSNLANETLESLGKSSDLDTTAESSDDSDAEEHNSKYMFKKKDFKLFKTSQDSKCVKLASKNKALKDVRFPGKNRLLSIIHLALLLTHSKIQLSDLLRFIRESHLSYAKVTHFFPNHIKFPKKDLSYIEVISDALMPTHLHQRAIAGKLGQLLKIEKIPTPDTNSLVDRYCQDLNLPEQIAELSKKVLKDRVPPFTIPRSRTPLPSFEAWAMVSVIFVMKLLLGLNDETEIFLSCLAQEVNCKRKDRSLFVFTDWQKFIECRKTVLTSFHYPTQEQLGGSSFQSSKKFLDTLMKESKDEARKDRFIPYPRYYMEEKLLTGIKHMLDALGKPQNVESLDFEPSLTPQTSHTEVIMRDRSLNEKCDDEEVKTRSAVFPETTLRQNYRRCDVTFALDAKSYVETLDESCEIFKKFDVGRGGFWDEALVGWHNFFNSNSSFNKSHELLNCSAKYWIFYYPDVESGHLCNFKSDVFENTPENFQWLLTECARMVEMNVRDVYDQLLCLEKHLSGEAEGVKSHSEHSE